MGMGFTIIDRSKWPREEYFRYFLRAVPCMYSMTVQLDVTPIMRQHARPYPATKINIVIGSLAARNIFLNSYEQDTAIYGNNRGLFGKPGRPANLFPVSVIPWIAYESLHLSFPRAFRYFIPMYTLGRLHRKRSRYYMPLALEVHHAVCDGYDAGAIIKEIQSLINGWKG